MNRSTRSERSATALWTACAALVGALMPGTALAQGQVVNPVSNFPIETDGLFTGGVSSGMIMGEWADITPVAFISLPDNNSGPAIPVALNNPSRNSLLYAAIAPEANGDIDDLYLMYDYLPRTNPIFSPGEFIADIAFPITLPESRGGRGDNTPIVVQFRGRSGGGGSGGQGQPPPGFDVFVDVNGDGNADFTAAALGMDAGLNFGPSTLSANNHLLIELGVPLRIPAGFADPNGRLPGNGINPATGLYDPDPAFWGAGIANNGVDPPASAAFFQILPTGQVVINPVGPAPVPEPSTLMMLGAGLATGALALRRRKKA